MAMSIRAVPRESLAYRSVPYAISAGLLFAAWYPLSWWLGLLVTAVIEANRRGQWPRCDPGPDMAIAVPASWIALAVLFSATFVPVSRDLVTDRHRRAISILVAAVVVGWGTTLLAVSTDAFCVFGWFVD